MKMKSLLVAFVILAALGLWLYYGPSDRQAGTGEQPPDHTVRIGILQHSSSIPFIVASTRRLFEQNGIDAELVNLTPAAHMPALLEGSVQLLSPSSFPVIFSTSIENPGAITCFLTGGESTSGDTLYGLVSNVGRYETLADLQGARIGSASRFTTLNLRNVARQVLGNSDQVEVVTISDRSALIAGLETKNFDAIVVDQPALASLAENPKLEVFEKNFRARYLRDPYWSGAAIADLKWTRTHSDLYGRVLDALDTALEWIASNPERARATLTEYYSIEDYSSKAIGMYVYPAASFSPPQEAVQELADHLIAAELLIQQPAYEELFAVR